MIEIFWTIHYIFHKVYSCEHDLGAGLLIFSLSLISLSLIIERQASKGASEPISAFWRDLQSQCMGASGEPEAGSYSFMLS